MLSGHQTEELVNDLSVQILTQPGMELCMMTLNKAWNKRYNDFMEPLKKSPVSFEHYLVEYCDKKLTTNPRWAYHAYRLRGNDPVLLRRYKLEAAKDIPWRDIIITWTLTTAANLFFKRLQTGLVSSAITVFYFCIMHVVTLGVFYYGKGCTNVKNLFRNMAIALVVINFMINFVTLL